VGNSPAITLNAYSHRMKSENQDEACRLENAILEETVTIWSQIQKMS